MALGRFLSPYVEKHGKNLLKTALPKDKNKNSAVSENQDETVNNVLKVSDKILHSLKFDGNFS